jgi:2,4-dichlorophenol 6-monooxygenase
VGEALVDADVVIIGGGPAGLSAAMLLTRLGVRVQLFERRATCSPLPRAHLLNQRTMEIFHEVGIADQVYALSPPENRWHRVGWYTSLAGPRAEQGREIGHVDAWGGGADAGRYAAASPRRYANVPQMRLDPLLRRNAEAACPGGVHFGHEVVGIRQSASGVTLDVVNPESGAVYAASGRYAIAADGGRLREDLLGVVMEGPTQLLDMVSMHVSADLSPWITDDEVLLYYFIAPRGQGNFTGALCAMGPDTWGRDSREWAIHQAFAWGDPESADTGGLRQRIRDMLGIPDLRFTVHSVSHWEFEGVTAQRFRQGDVFLVGNAAHRHPPTGGLGLNTAVQDVHNLAWKLALVLHGHAGDALLDSYEAERRPVGLRNVDHSLRNAGGHRRIAAALGQRPGQTEQDGWDEIASWLQEGPAGEMRREAVAEAVGSNSDDYGQLNIETGFSYDSQAVIPDGSPPPATHGALRDYTPTTRPGHHLPHAWLDAGGATTSTVDLVPGDSFVLLVTGAADAAWRMAAETVRPSLPVALDVVAIGHGAGLSDPLGDWESVRGTEAGGAILVRPDRHIAWRCAVAPPEPEAALRRALALILGHPAGSARHLRQRTGHNHEMEVP